MSDRELWRLADRIYKMSHREIWLGGRVDIERRVVGKKPIEWVNIYPNWPESLPCPKWGPGHTWTLSPEVELGGLRTRVCVNWDGREDACGVTVFIDDAVRYPGGHYKQPIPNEFYSLWSFLVRRFFGVNWAVRLAELEQRDGGRIGYINRRDLLIAEAARHLGAPTVRHQIEAAPPDPEAEAVAAVREVEAWLAPEVDR